MVAATIPKVSAARNTTFPLLSPMVVVGYSLVRRIALLGALAGLAACTEATAPAARFAVLDDQGQSDWQTVSVGAEHSCALKTDGSAYCWGANRYYQLGVAIADTACGRPPQLVQCAMRPQAILPGVKLRSISAGAKHTCAITIDREALCWGGNDNGQVDQIAPTGPDPTLIGSGSAWTDISAGYSHTCAVRTDGAAFCWGANDRGQLGDGSTGTVSGPVRVRIPAPVSSISAGQQRSCARTVAGDVYCWGATWLERQGSFEMTKAEPNPLRVPSAPAMRSVAVGTFTTCGSDLSGVGYCWEANPRGGMGTGSLEGSQSPRRIALDLEFVQLSAGIVQTCGVVSNGAGYCWGDDTFGQLGVSPSRLIERCGEQRLPCSTTPVPVYGRQQFTEISTGFGSHTCGVTVRGNLYCWGLGVSGQRGDGTDSYAATIPLQVLEPRARP